MTGRRLFQLWLTFLFVLPQCLADSVDRPSVLMELHHRLDPSSSSGEYEGPGVCSRIYKILKQTQISPVEECSRLGNFRQSGLGDIAQFYQALSRNSSFSETLDFPLADKFPRFSFRASFVHVPMHANEPAVMIETGSRGSHIVCVQSVPCSPTAASPSSTATSGSTTTPPGQVDSLLLPAAVTTPTELPEASNLSSAAAAAVLSRNEAFWEALLLGTEAKTWFIATVCLSVVALLLLVVLAVTWVYIYRIRRLHRRRRCRGPCRRGCQCPPETVRKSMTDAAVCGPFEPAPRQYKQMISGSLSSPGNGSINNGMMPGGGCGAGGGGGGCGPVYGGSFVYPYGTMTSSRWCGSPTQKAAVGLSTPLCGSITNGGEKNTLLSHSNYMVHSPTGLCHQKVASDTDQWAFAADGTAALPSRSVSQIHRRPPSREAVCHTNNNASDGSSISGHGIKLSTSQSMQQQHQQQHLQQQQHQQQSRFAYPPSNNPQEYSESEMTTPLPTASLHMMGRAGRESPYGGLPETGPPAVDDQVQRSRLLMMIPSKHSTAQSPGYATTASMSPNYNCNTFSGHGNLQMGACDSFNMTTLSSCLPPDRHAMNGYGVDTNSFKGAINSQYSERLRAATRDATGMMSGDVCQVTDIAPPSDFYDHTITGEGLPVSGDCSMRLNSSLVIPNAGVVGAVVRSGKTSPPATGNGQLMMVNGTSKLATSNFRPTPLSGENCNSLQYRPILLMDDDNNTNKSGGEPDWAMTDSGMVGIVDSVTGGGYTGPSHNQALHNHQHSLDLSRNLLPSRLYGASERML